MSSGTLRQMLTSRHQGQPQQRQNPVSHRLQQEPKPPPQQAPKRQQPRVMTVGIRGERQPQQLPQNAKQEAAAENRQSHNSNKSTPHDGRLPRVVRQPNRHLQG